MNVELKTGKLIEKLARLKNMRVNSLMLKTATEARDMIYQRSLQGIGVDGEPFKEYAELTKQFRLKKGRNIDSDRLVFTGLMMRNMQARHIPGGAVVGFNNPKELAKAKKNQERYNWFGISQGERAKIQKDLKGLIKIELRKQSK